MRHKTLIALLATLAAGAALIWGPGLTGAGRPGPAEIAVAFPAGPDFQFTPPEPGSYALPRIKTAPDGTVIDGEGRAHRLAEITRGKISLVSFVYLNCGDVSGCPLAIGTLFDIYEGSAALPGLAKAMQQITISFDPARDTPEAIAAFAYPILNDTGADRKIGWRVLTTSDAAALQPILAGYGQVIDRSPDQDSISHLLRLYLLDARGEIRNIYGLGQIDPRLIMTDVATLMMEDGA